MPQIMKSLVCFLLFLLGFISYSQELAMEIIDITEEESYQNLFLGFTPTMPVPSEEQLLADSFWSEAENAGEQGNYELEASHLEKAMILNPKLENQFTINRLAKALLFSGQKVEALVRFHQLFQQYSHETPKSDLLTYTQLTEELVSKKEAKKVMKWLDKKFPDWNFKFHLRQLRQNKHRDSLGIAIKNLEINTKYQDFAPMPVYHDELLFSSSRPFEKKPNTGRAKEQYFDLYRAKVNSKNIIIPSHNSLKSPINTAFHEAAACYTPDHKTLFFTRNRYASDEKTNGVKKDVLQIYYTQKTEEGWTEPIKAPFNFQGYSSGHPFISDDGKRLFFSSDRPGGFGDSDIYVVDIIGDNQFSNPKNLGRKINSPYKENYPSLEGSILFYSSNRPNGLGGLDIYQVNLMEESRILPQNLGAPINSKYDDFAYVALPKTDQGFFTSNRKGGKGGDDLYFFERPTRPIKEKKVTGTVLDVLTQTPLGQIKIELYSENQIKIAESSTNDKGEFVFPELKKKENYIIKAKADGYHSLAKLSWKLQGVNLKMIPSTPELNESTLNNTKTHLATELTSEGNTMNKVNNETEPITSNTVLSEPAVIYHEYNAYKMGSSEVAVLQNVIKKLKNNPNQKIRIESHTDNRGKASYNLALSNKRAATTKQYLLDHGVMSSQIINVKGFGETQPVQSCSDNRPCTAATHQLNRRTEIVWVD